MRYENFESHHFIRGYHKLTMETSDFHLTPHEYYVYCLLFIKKHQDESIVVSSEMIDYYMFVKFADREQTHKSLILKALKGLIEKKVLLLVDDMNLEDIKNKTFVTLIINDEKLSTRSEEISGFRKIYNKDFLIFKNVYELYIYATVSRYEHFNSSYGRWAKLLNVKSKSTAKKYLDKAEERNLITIKRGAYIDYNNQEINSYSVTKFTEKELEEKKYADRNKDENLKLAAEDVF